MYKGVRTSFYLFYLIFLVLLKNCINRAILMDTLNIPLCFESPKYLSHYVSRISVRINSLWLEHIMNDIYDHKDEDSLHLPFTNKIGKKYDQNKQKNMKKSAHVVALFPQVNVWIHLMRDRSNQYQASG